MSGHMAALPAVQPGPANPSPAARQHITSPLLDKVKAVAAPLLVVLGLIIFLSAVVTLGGHLFGYMAIPSDTVQMLFTASIMSIISGFHLAQGRDDSLAVNVGPLSLG